ncbi:unnamed protein product [Spirodela intermedia]|uniref:Uncharacterized protein n=1 Tax=Spirodela intermedia TaxID=51605 RepID=A0A7I8JBM1_SPIIN|nr:unnamed protein product [Spirodela intermedia]CAA6667490.1 unnamed protein product [Spirodela intermedia]
MAEAAAEAFELRNGSVAVKVSNWPATITSLLLPDSHGSFANVVLGFDTLSRTPQSTNKCTSPSNEGGWENRRR